LRQWNRSARLGAILLVAFFTGRPAAAEFSRRFHLELLPQYRELNPGHAVPDDQSHELYLLIDETWQWSSGSWYVEVKPQIRAVQSPAVAKSRPVTATAAWTEKRVLDSRRRIERSPDRDVEFDFDRLNLRYQFEQGEVYAGRRPIGLGVLRFFPVWNKLNMQLSFASGPQWIENPDSVGASWQSGRLALQVFAARTGDEPRTDDLAVAVGKYFGESVEAQVLAGSWWRHSAAGLALSKDWHDHTFRLESLGLDAVDGGRPLMQIGLGMETALGERWVVIGEYLHQNLGRSLADGYGLAPLNRFMVLNGRHYALAHGSYQWNTEWRLGGGALVNVLDPSGAVLLDADYAWSDFTSFTLKAHWPFGRRGSEFASERADASLLAGLMMTL
jgi:hypothetical protein